MLSQNELKQQVAQAALNYILPYLAPQAIIGIGTGSTADLFIDELAQYRDRFLGAVASSERSQARLQAHGIAVFDLNEVESMPVYVDGADEINAQLEMIKGGGGALTREKIVASVAERFVCIVDESKQVSVLGEFPLPVEVLPMAKAAVARQLYALGATEVLERAGFLTDNQCPILDAKGLHITQAKELETRINQIAGVVTCGLFAVSPADVALVGTQSGVLIIEKD